MDPLRVAFDVGPLLGHRTGVGQAVAAMHDALSRNAAGQDTPNQNAGDRDHEITLSDYIVSFRSRPPQGARRLPIPALVAQRLWAVSDRPRADRWLGSPDVVHGTNYVVPPALAPQVVSVYDCWFLRNPQLASRNVRLAGRVLHRAIERGATVHACSVATEAQILDIFPESRVAMIALAAIPLPPPVASTPMPDLAQRPCIVAIGTLERRKNLPALVTAFGHLAAAESEPVLVMAGADGDDRPAVNAAIDRLPPAIAQRVILTGRVDEPTRSWLLHNAAVLAYPSLDEGFGFPLLDAMQAGLPIVASRRGSIPELCADAALLCEPADEVALAEQLRSALFDTATRARLIAAGTARLTQFSWQTCAAELTGLYRRLAAEGRR
jgi:glycosyltransferase involved in cell wall biosynthesis